MLVTVKITDHQTAQGDLVEHHLDGSVTINVDGKLVKGTPIWRARPATGKPSNTT